MRKNLYTKTINDIKISENAVNSAIENIYSKQSNIKLLHQLRHSCVSSVSFVFLELRAKLQKISI